MFPRFVFACFLLVALVFCGKAAFAGKVELTTYYPAPYGEYKNLTSTEDAYFATTSGGVGIGTTNPVSPLEIDAHLPITDGNNYHNDIVLRSYVVADPNGPTYMAPGLVLEQYRGTSDSRLPLKNGDMLGGVTFGGWTGTSAFPTSEISANAEGDFSAGYRNTSLSFSTTGVYDNQLLSLMPETRMTIHGNGNVVIGYGADTNGNAIVNRLQVDNGGIAQYSYSNRINPSGTAPQYYFVSRKSRGDQNAPSTVSNGDTLGGLMADGYITGQANWYDEPQASPSYFHHAALIGFAVDGAVSANPPSATVPGCITFSTTAPGAADTSASPPYSIPPYTERMRITSSGKVGIGTTAPQGALDVVSTSGAFIVPRMTTAQRDALTAVNGMIIYNTSTNQFNFRENGAWVLK